MTLPVILPVEIERYSFDGHTFITTPFIDGARLTGQYFPPSGMEPMFLVEEIDQNNEVGRRIVKRILALSGVGHVVAHQRGLTVNDQWWVRDWVEIKNDVIQILGEELNYRVTISREYNGSRYHPRSPHFL